MAHIKCRWTESVGGNILGGVSHTGCLMYDDRKQSGNFHASTEDGLITLAKQRYEWFKSDLGEHFHDIYPKDTWWLKIYTD